MDDAALVRRFERLGDLPRDRQRFVERDRPPRDAIGQRRTVDQLHHEIVGPDVVQRADVRVVERGDGAGLALETVAETFGATLIATSRPRRESRARYTAPMPPDPSVPTICTGPAWSRASLRTAYVNSAWLPRPQPAP